MNRFPPRGPPGQPSERALRSLFVGNIAYDVSEEELTQAFQQVGPVVSFRLVYDRESGKSKGFGFCEYADTATANAALRAMNQFELKGRPLRLDSAVANERMMFNDDFRGGPGPGGPPPYAAPRPPPPRPQMPPAAAESPYGPIPTDGRVPEAIAKELNKISPDMMYKVITDMKELAIRNPQRCRHLLDSNPQLAFALLQAQVITKYMDIDTAYQLLDRNMTSEKLAERARVSAAASAHEEIERNGGAPLPPFAGPTGLPQRPATSLLGQPHVVAPPPAVLPQPLPPPVQAPAGPPPPAFFNAPAPTAPVHYPPVTQSSWIPPNQAPVRPGPPPMMPPFGQPAPMDYNDGGGGGGGFRGYNRPPLLPPAGQHYGGPGGPIPGPGPIPGAYGGPRPSILGGPSYGHPPRHPGPGPAQQAHPIPAQSSAPGGNLEGEELEMVRQLLLLTDDQINELAPEEQRKIREFKSQYARR